MMNTRMLQLRSRLGIGRGTRTGKLAREWPSVARRARPAQLTDGPLPMGQEPRGPQRCHRHVRWQTDSVVASRFIPPWPILRALPSSKSRSSIGRSSRWIKSCNGKRQLSTPAACPRRLRPVPKR